MQVAAKKRGDVFLPKDKSIFRIIRDRLLGFLGKAGRK
jgi:hypothetical protein